MTPTAFFNLRHAVISQSYYAKCVQFHIDHLGPVSLIQRKSAVPSLSGKERSTRKPQFTRQILRSNRREMTVEQRRRQDYNRQYYAAKRAAEQLALGLES